MRDRLKQMKLAAASRKQENEASHITGGEGQTKNIREVPAGQEARQPAMALFAEALESCRSVASHPAHGCPGDSSTSFLPGGDSLVGGKRALFPALGSV